LNTQGGWGDSSSYDDNPEKEKLIPEANVSEQRVGLAKPICKGLSLPQSLLFAPSGDSKAYYMNFALHSGRGGN
jgi:hypothetical protein